MGFRTALVTVFLRLGLRVVCRIDNREMKRISRKGPMIVAMNHINFLEVPIIQTELYPRIMRGMVKQETWDSKIMHFLLITYKAIPVFRGEGNLSAFKSAADTLRAGHFVCIAPEGTRSKTGILQEGKPGITHLALITGAPIIPVVHFGGENFWANLKRFRRTRFTLKVGRPFRLKSQGRTTHEIRDEMTREIMYQLAALLPEEYRGPFADETKKSVRHIDFCPEAE